MAKQVYGKTKFCEEMRQLRYDIKEGKVAANTAMAMNKAANNELKAEISDVYYQTKRMERPDSEFFNN